ncbi:MAG: hypothetical protein LHW53_04095 [Candidatus Cloacimonetes bacterium]|nr:hypothetical protein [Candidatus Cloacimonadota bacterium]
MEYAVNTTLDTLAEAYIILADLGLAGMLDGGAMEIRPNELLDALFAKKRLHEFLALITGSAAEEMGKLRPSEALDIVSAFFLDLSAELRCLPGILTSITSARPTPPSAK